MFSMYFSGTPTIHQYTGKFVIVLLKFLLEYLNCTYNERSQGKKLFRLNTKK